MNYPWSVHHRHGNMPLINDVKGSILMRKFLAVVTFLFVGGTFASEEVPGLIIEEIQKGVYLHKSFSRVDGFGLVSSNGLVVIDQGKAFIVDTPWSDQDTEKLVKWIKGNNYQLTGSISTHSHDDRTAGIKWLNSHSIATYVSVSTNNLLKSAGKEVASNTFEESGALLAGGLVEAYYPGGGHTIDNIVVWLPNSNILFGGCFVRSLDSKSLGYIGEATIDKWPSSVDRVMSKFSEAKLVIPGHGEIGGVQLLMHTKKLAESALTKASD